jgi:hypothetical protein
VFFTLFSEETKNVAGSIRDEVSNDSRPSYMHILLVFRVHRKNNSKTHSPLSEGKVIHKSYESRGIDVIEKAWAIIFFKNKIDGEKRFKECLIVFL